MKKGILIFVALIFVASMCFVFVGCDKNGAETEINIVVPDGAPALAVAPIISSLKVDGYKINFEIVAGAPDIAAKVANGDADIAIMPTNIGAKLYNSGSADIKMVAANVYGLLYLVGTEEISSIGDLKNKKILCTGQGGTPDFVFKYILSENGVSAEGMNIEYIAQGSDAIAALKQNTAQFAVLGEPAATMAKNKANASVVLDMQSEWEKLTGFRGYPQAGTFVKSSVLQKDAAFIKQFLSAMNNNTQWIVEGENYKAVNEALKAFNSNSTFASADVIKRCNIRYVDAVSAKEALENYFGVMTAADSKFIGGKKPADEFYAKVELE